jgi:2-polyprenyl-6-methoxyphenol hydroxylase-like FAD-dependent oxidoreductase
MEECEVIIIGGGPVGLALATELAWRGRKPVLIDQTDGVIRHPRAGGISLRTMEHCRRWGAAERVANAGFNLNLPLNQRFCTSVYGYELATARFPSINETKTPPESPQKVARCRQMWLDPILTQTARSHGADVRHRHRVERFVQDDDGVTCDIHDLEADERSQLRGKYMVAADGVNGFVREALGIEMDGKIIGDSISILFKANIYELGGEPCERYILTGPKGNIGNITAMDGFSYFRMILRGAPAFDPKTFDAEGHVRAAIGSPDAKVEIISVFPWRRQVRVAEHFQKGRVFLAGDCAHVMVPTGGFGFNTGVGSAVDLGWKLDGVLSGWGGAHLLESYELERRPIASRNVAAAHKLHEAWSPPGDMAKILDDTPEGTALRAKVGEQLMEGTKAEWESMGVALGYAYQNSPICVPDGTPAPPDDPHKYIPTARPGHRAPHVWLADGRSILDLFGRGFTLLRFEGDDESEVGDFGAVAAQQRLPVRIHDIRNNNARDIYQQRLVLVRPDGHVAWRGAKLPNAKELIDAVTGA